MNFMNNDPLLSEAQRQEDVAQQLQVSFTRRVFLAIMLVIVGILGLLTRMFYLQVKRYSYYRTRAKTNRIRVKPLTPTRGIIFDRNGIALTENILRYQVVVNPSQVGNISETVKSVQTYIFISTEEVEDFLKRYKQTRRYENVPLKMSINEAEYYRLSVHLYQIPGVEIIPYYERYYPYGAIISHVVGYTNRINAQDLEVIDRDAYRGIQTIGRRGIEQQYETLLRGVSGYQQVETDANGSIVRFLSRVDGQRGQDIYLTLDVSLQQFIYERLGEFRGSCVVINPQNGEILAMVSKPSFDANLFTQGISQQQYQSLLKNPEKPLFDRAMKGQYPPGSVIKPAVLLAGMHHQIVDKYTYINCPGYYQIPESHSERRFHCWKRRGHGSLNAEQALMQSCDVYFYSLGYRLGIDKLADDLRYFGLGARTGVDLPGEGSGILPTQQWKKERFSQKWYWGDTVNMSIGQGFLTTTPLQLAYMTSQIAQSGQTFTPHLLKRVYNPEAQTFIPNSAIKAPSIDIFHATAWQLVKQGMENVIHHQNGTAHGISKGITYRMAGKSGTVQVISFKDNLNPSNEQSDKELQDNAMFIAYAPANAPTIALSVVIERGRGGSSTAAPIARDILDFCLIGSQKEKNNAPT